MDGCTRSSDIGAGSMSSASVSRKRRRPARDDARANDTRTYIAMDTKYDNDPLAPFHSRIVRMMRTNGTIADLRNDAEFVPKSSPDLLYRLSKEQLDPRNHVGLSLHLYVLIRETERIAAAVADETERPSGADASSDAETDLRANVRNLERILRNLSDFGLRHRHNDRQMDEETQNGGMAGLDNDTGGGKPLTEAGEDPDVLRESHRTVLWIARCKIIDLLRNVAGAQPRVNAINEPMRLRAAAVSDEQFARWMQQRNVCDRSMLVFDADGAVVGHRIQRANLVSLWLTLKLAIGRWPHLPFDEYAFRLYDELLARAAFFVSYREHVDPQSAGGRALLGITGTAKKKVLGLSLNMWQVRDLIARSRARQVAPGERLESPTLLNMAAFVRHSGQYAHVNDRFVRETERIFASLERVLRTASGFRWHIGQPVGDGGGGGGGCLACEELARVTPEHVRRFEDFCADQMRGMFKDFVRESFQERVYSLYLKPSDAERFRRLNPADLSSARNIIAREQRELHRRLNESYISPQMSTIWDSLRGQPAEPAYTLLAALAASYSVQQLVDGAKMTRYLHSLSLLEPYAYNDERIPKTRSVYGELHTQLETTGTLRFRNKLVRSLGLMAPAEEINYQHPVLAHAMNSVLLCYDGHMHACPLGFGQAFVAWLAVMCRDEAIGGQMNNRGFLHRLWYQLAPERTAEAQQALQKSERRVHRWDPVKQLLNCDDELARVGRGLNETQF